MQETRTAASAADHQRQAGFEVTTGVDGTGVVGLLGNGDGPTSKVTAKDKEGHTVRNARFAEKMRCRRQPHRNAISVLLLNDTYDIVRQ